MKIENQVCTIEQSKKITELTNDFNLESHFVYVPKFPVFNDELRLTTFIEFERRLRNSILSDDAKALVTYYPAFTLSELGQMLSYENVPYFSTEYDMWMLPKGSKLKGQGLGSINEAVIRAELLIYALENKLLSSETCNERLIA